MKKISRIQILIVLAITVFFLPCQADGDVTETKSDQSTVAVESKIMLRVYYFHGDRRCKTCNAIETNTKALLDSRFVDELKSGKIKWSVKNTDKEENAHFEKDFNLLFGSVIVEKVINGKQSEWKNLNKVWELAWDKANFNKYIETELTAYLAK